MAAQAGESRVVDITLSTAASDADLRGKTVKATFEIKDLKTLRLPELTHEFLHEYGVHSPDELHELVRVVLQRRLEYTQRQSAREQVMAQHQRFAALRGSCRKTCWSVSAHGDGPAYNGDANHDGISEEEIAQRQAACCNKIAVLRSTEMALKEHFVLQKIAEVEKIEISEDDLTDEIERMAEQSDESPRRCAPDWKRKT